MFIAEPAIELILGADGIQTRHADGSLRTWHPGMSLSAVLEVSGLRSDYWPPESAPEGDVAREHGHEYDGPRRRYVALDPHRQAWDRSAVRRVE